MVQALHRRRAPKHDPRIPLLTFAPTQAMAVDGRPVHSTERPSAGPGSTAPGSPCLPGTGGSFATSAAERIEQDEPTHGSRYSSRPQESSAWPRWCHRRIFANWWKGKTGDKVHELGEQISLLQPHLQRPGTLGGYMAFDLCRQTACSSPPLSCPRSAAASSYNARNWAYGRSGTPASTAKARRCTSTATCERPTRLPM